MSRLAFVALAVALMAAPVAAAASDEAWAALVKVGHVALIRHGNAPPGYGGDPPGFRIDDWPMCRCLETGRSVETSWALLPDTGPSPTRFLELKEIVSSWRGPGTLVLVTHALTVRPLTGFLPEQAETIVLKPSPESSRGGSLVGRIAPPH